MPAKETDGSELSTTLFYDSVTPEQIPADAIAACLYYDGDWKATPEEAQRFKHVRWITVTGDWQNCGIADFEEGNPVYDNADALRTYVAGRIGMNKRARVYTDRANLPTVRQRLEGLSYLVWIGTLDGTMLEPDYTEGLWAVQFQGATVHGNYDTSILYKPW